MSLMLSKQSKSIIIDEGKLLPQATPQAAGETETDKIAALLEYCIEPRSRVEIQEYMGLKDREYFRLEILNPLIHEGKLHLTIPDKPTSPNQKYYSRSESQKND